MTNFRFHQISVKTIENQQKHIFWTLEKIENINIRNENKRKIDIMTFPDFGAYRASKIMPPRRGFVTAIFTAKAKRESKRHVVRAP